MKLILRDEDTTLEVDTFKSSDSPVFLEIRVEPAKTGTIIELNKAQAHLLRNFLVRHVQ
jgi:hypothetical protein